MAIAVTRAPSGTLAGRLICCPKVGAAAPFVIATCAGNPESGSLLSRTYGYQSPIIRAVPSGVWATSPVFQPCSQSQLIWMTPPFPWKRPTFVRLYGVGFAGFVRDDRAQPHWVMTYR